MKIERFEVVISPFRVGFEYDISEYGEDSKEEDFEKVLYFNTKVVVEGKETVESVLITPHDLKSNLDQVFDIAKSRIRRRLEDDGT